MYRQSFRVLIGFVIVFATWAATPASAQTSADLYRGKQIRILVGYAPGGGYDTYARAVAEALSRNIPGNPSVLVQNMPGADGLALANYMAQLAPRDGTVIALTNRNLVVAPLLGLIDPSSVHYDPIQFDWIGNLNSEVSVVIVKSDLGIRDIEDLRRREVVVGSTGLTSENGIYPYIVNNLLGTRLKVVTGYPSTSGVMLALESGEVGGIGGLSWSSLQVQRPDWIKNKVITPLIQLGLHPAPELANVPLIRDLARTDDEKRALDLIFVPEELGRAFFIPPGSPEQAIGILREAFAALIKDPEFTQVAKSARLDIAFTSGASVQDLVTRLNSAPPSVVELARRLPKRDTDQSGQK